MKCLEIKIIVAPTSAMPVRTVHIYILSALMSKTIMQFIEKPAAYSTFHFLRRDWEPDVIINISVHFCSGCCASDHHLCHWEGSSQKPDKVTWLRAHLQIDRSCYKQPEDFSFTPDPCVFLTVINSYLKVLYTLSSTEGEFLQSANFHEHPSYQRPFVHRSNYFTREGSEYYANFHRAPSHQAERFVSWWNVKAVELLFFITMWHAQ